jgi:hypothetical protein
MLNCWHSPFQEHFFPGFKTVIVSICKYTILVASYSIRAHVRATGIAVFLSGRVLFICDLSHSIFKMEFFRIGRLCIALKESLKGTVTRDFFASTPSGRCSLLTYLHNIEGVTYRDSYTRFFCINSIWPVQLHNVRLQNESVTRCLVIKTFIAHNKISQNFKVAERIVTKSRITKSIITKRIITKRFCASII